VNQIRFVPTLIVLQCVLFAGALHAESKWKIANLNPFTKETPEARGNGVPKEGASPFRLSALGGKPGVKPSEAKRPDKPSGWSKFATSTKNFWNKTKQALNPWGKSSADGSSRNDAARFQLGLGRNNREKKSLFAGWLRPKDDEPQQPQSVAEFLAQPRPQ
jgi:hypothetical protein